jgi:hypothetical protein
MNAAVSVIVGLALVAFGSWRLLAGFYRLDLIGWRVPGHDLFVRFVPRWMKGPDMADGLADAIGGLIFVAGGVLFMSAA